MDDLLRKKIEDCFSNQELLLGDFDFKDEEIDDIKSFAYKALKSGKYGSETAEIVDMALIISIVNGLKKWDKDWDGGIFWNRVYSLFDEDQILKDGKRISDILKSSKFYEAVDSIFKKNNRILFRSNNNVRRFDQTFLFQSLAPKKSMDALIKLAWGMFINEDLLDYYYEEDLDFCNSIMKSIKNKLSHTNNGDEDEVISFDGATYTLKKSVQYGIEQNPKSANLLNRILTYINAAYDNQEVLDNHLGILVTDQVESLKKASISNGNGGRRKERRFSEKYIKDINKISPKFKCNDDIDDIRIYVHIPKVVLDSTKKYDYAFFKILNDGKKLYETSFDFKHIESIQTLKEINVDITNFINKINGLEIVLKYDNQLIFDKSYSNNYLLFKECNQIEGNCRKGFYYLCTDESFDMNCLHLINGYAEIAPNIYSIETDEGDSIDGNNAVVFGTFKSNSVRFKDEPIINKYIKIKYENREVQLINNISDLTIFLKNDENPKAIVIYHTYIDKEGNKKTSNCKISDLNKDGERYIYSCDDNNLSLDGYHEIQINRLAQNNANSIDRYEYFHDYNFRYNSHQCLTYNNSFIFKIKLFDESYDVNASLESNFEEIKILDYDSTAIVSIPYLRWSFDTINRGFVQVNRISNESKPWFNDEILHTSSLKIDSLYDVENVFFKNDKGVITNLSKGKKSEFKLGEFIQCHNEKGTFFVNLEKIKEPVQLFSITNEPYIVPRQFDDSFIFEDDKLYVDFSKYFMHGIKKYVMSVRLYSEIKEYVFEVDNVDMIFEYGEILEDIYDVELTYKEVNGDIVVREKGIILNEDDYLILGDEYKICFIRSSALRFKKTKISQNESVKLDKYYIKDPNYLKKNEKGENVYTGKLVGLNNLLIIFTQKDEKYIKELLFNDQKIVYDRDKKELCIDNGKIKNKCELLSISVNAD